MFLMTTTGKHLHHTVSNRDQPAALPPDVSSGLSSKNSTSVDVAASNAHTNTTTNSKYAYAFVIGGCNPDKPAYRGFVYDILVSTQILRNQGSTADVVAFFQLSVAYKGGTELPLKDAKPLQSLGVHIYYILPSEKESFYEIVMNKFRILTLTQYRRVLFLDGDVMPIGNLDYLFELSDDNKYGPGNSTLKPNLIIAGKSEPANAGFFMLTPGEGEYEQVQDIIRTRETKARALNESVKFDVLHGWGHAITEPDEWKSRSTRRGRNWNFAFAYSDQWLLYHWVKYVKKQVSIVFQDYVDNVSLDSQGNVVMEQRLQDPFRNYSKPLIYSELECRKFMCDFVHFTGNTKPWMQRTPVDFLNTTMEPRDRAELWWYTMKTVNENLQMGLDFDNWTYVGRPCKYSIIEE